MIKKWEWEMSLGFLKPIDFFLGCMAQLIEYCPLHQEVTSLITGPGTFLGYGHNPQ